MRARKLGDGSMQSDGREENGGWALPRRAEAGQVRGPLLGAGTERGEQSSSPRLGRAQRDRSDAKEVPWPPEHLLGVSRRLAQVNITVNNIFVATWRFRLLHNVIKY